MWAGCRFRPEIQLPRKSWTFRTVSQHWKHTIVTRLIAIAYTNICNQTRYAHTNLYIIMFIVYKSIRARLRSAGERWPKSRNNVGSCFKRIKSCRKRGNFAIRITTRFAKYPRDRQHTIVHCQTWTEQRRSTVEQLEEEQLSSPEKMRRPSRRVQTSV